MILHSVETASREQMRALQTERLTATVRHVCERVPYYAQKLKEAGIEPGDIRSLEDLPRLPFTTKDDLRQNYPYGLVAVPQKEVVRVHASSGTTGQPTVVAYTKADLAMWADCVARLAVAAGASNEDTAQISFGYSLFTGAFGLHYGLELLGASIIPISGGNTERQIMVMKDFGTTLLVATPSYALYLAETAEKMGVLPDLRLRLGMFGGEGMTQSMRYEIEKRFHISATQNYGLSEIVGPGVSGECTHKCGLHINEDCFLPEIIDPVTLKPLPLGEKGELVLTTINKWGMPLLRYRTKDITSLTEEKCACGRTTVRHAIVEGRSDDMLIIRGVNVFPSQIEEVLLKVPEIGPSYEIVVRREHYLDTLEIRVELLDAALLESFAALEALEKKIKGALRVQLQIDAKVTLVEPFTLKRFEGKRKNVTDLR